MIGICDLLPQNVGLLKWPDGLVFVTCYYTKPKGYLNDLICTCDLLLQNLGLLEWPDGLVFVTR